MTTLFKKLTRWITLCALPLLASGATAEPVRIVLFGDSTVATYEGGAREFYGWGHFLQDELGAGFAVFNHAKAGRSSKSFWDEGRVAPGMNNKPDIVIIQFGHNDSPGKGPKLETNPADSYRDQLRLYLKIVRDAGARPILVTPVVRKNFNPDGRIDNTRLRPYADAMLAVAREDKVPCFDLNAESLRLFESLGPEKTLPLNPAQNPKDATHYSAEGARKITGMVVAFLRETMPGVFTPASATSSK